MPEARKCTRRQAGLRAVFFEAVKTAAVQIAIRNASRLSSPNASASKNCAEITCEQASPIMVTTKKFVSPIERSIRPKKSQSSVLATAELIFSAIRRSEKKAGSLSCSVARSAFDLGNSRSRTLPSPVASLLSVGFFVVVDFIYVEQLLEPAWGTFLSRGFVNPHDSSFHAVVLRARRA